MVGQEFPAEQCREIPRRGPDWVGQGPLRRPFQLPQFLPPFPKRHKEPVTMDQLKTQLAMVKQHSFWALCLGILGVSIGSWWVSTSKLAAERAAQESKIKSGFSDVKTVMGVPLHPNQTV